MVACFQNLKLVSNFIGCISLLNVTRGGPIVDAAVTKRHQWRDKIRIIFTRTSFKSCFQESSVMQYTPSGVYILANSLLLGRGNNSAKFEIGEETQEETIKMCALNEEEV